jgi:hypothetical protein
VHTSDLSDFDPEISDLSSDDADIDGDAPWRENIVQWDEEPFMETVGPTRPLPYDAKPVDYFLQLFPNDFIETIKIETELYARQRGDANFITSVPEIKAYIGCLFLMGLVPMKSYRMHWSQEPDCITQWLQK